MNRWGRRCFKVLSALLLACLISEPSTAQILDIDEIIGSAIKKVIVAMDLRIERLQTETIEAQTVEKKRSNDMQQLELDDIAMWVEDQRILFASYYQELRQVKNVIASFRKVKDMVDKQAKIITGYQQVYAAMQKDRHFSLNELNMAYSVMAGIALQSANNIKHLSLIITSMIMQMDDEARIRFVDGLGKDIDRCYSELARFSQRTFLLSLQRARDENDLTVTRKLYGL